MLPGQFGPQYVGYTYNYCNYSQNRIKIQLFLWHHNILEPFFTKKKALFQPFFVIFFFFCYLHQRRHMSSRWEGVLLFDILSSVSSQNWPNLSSRWEDGLHLTFCPPFFVDQNQKWSGHSKTQNKHIKKITFLGGIWPVLPGT